MQIPEIMPKGFHLYCIYAKDIIILRIDPYTLYVHVYINQELISNVHVYMTKIIVPRIDLPI